VRARKKLVAFAVTALHRVDGLDRGGPGLLEEMSTISDTTEGTADLRLEVWKIGLRMFAANPVLGVGADNFRWVVGDYQSQEQSEKYGRSLGEVSSLTPCSWSCWRSLAPPARACS